jgi:ABC-2 type transport system permease protein
MTSTVRWLLAAWGANLRSALEYRASFLVQASFMLVNNLTFLAFWAVLFARFERIGGWTLQDVALCYGIGAMGFGLTAVLFGGSFELAGLVARGGVDNWLLRSRPSLLQALVARTRISGFGDLATGPLLLILTKTWEPHRLAWFAVGSITACLVITSFLVLLGSAAFWAGQADDLAMTGLNALLSFGFYPPGIFGGVTRLVLYVLVPSGLMTWLPVSLMRSFDLRDAAGLVAGVAAFVMAASLAWRHGLRRYESGNLTLAAGE